MKATILGGVLATATILVFSAPAFAFCSLAGDAQAQLDCQRGQLDQARQASEELERVSQDRRLMETLTPDNSRESNETIRWMLDSRERNARQDLDSALSR